MTVKNGASGINGVININKPEGWTSQDVCAKLRNRLQIKKAGHTGTLDPMAAGVLPVCIGNATRIIEYYDRDAKSYHAAMKLGIVTDTLDITGEVLETKSYADVSEKAVREAFNAYVGEISQLPPKYSALRVNGRRAYDLAREGKDFVLPSRTVSIFENKVTFLDLDNGMIEFDAACSKGTYIRTICDDIGRTLGCGAVMTSLVRTSSGPFSIAESVGIEELCGMSDDEIRKVIIPADKTLEKLGIAILSNSRVTAFRNGNPSYMTSVKIRQESSFDSLYRVYCRSAALQQEADADDPDGMVFLGIASVKNASLVPLKVMHS